MKKKIIIFFMICLKKIGTIHPKYWLFWSNVSHNVCLRITASTGSNNTPINYFCSFPNYRMCRNMSKYVVLYVFGSKGRLGRKWCLSGDGKLLLYSMDTSEKIFQKPDKIRQIIGFIQSSSSGKFCNFTKFLMKFTKIK